MNLTQPQRFALRLAHRQGGALGNRSRYPTTATIHALIRKGLMAKARCGPYHLTEAGAVLAASLEAKFQASARPLPLLTKETS